MESKFFFHDEKRNHERNRIRQIQSLVAISRIVIRRFSSIAAFTLSSSASGRGTWRVFNVEIVGTNFRH